MNAEIFVPMFYMVLLTFTVSLVGTIVRFKNVLIDKKHTGIEMMKFSPPSSASVIIKQADRNLTNLFEFPILYITGKVDSYFVLLAYWFVGLRVAHSVYHIFINGFIGDTPLRAIFWLPSLLIVIWMWIRFILLI